MKSRVKKCLAITALLTAALIAVVCVTVGCLSSRSKTLGFKVSYYYVYYRIQDDIASASSISSTVQSYGGAGYIISYSGKYYITVSCYYTPEDANLVCANLKLNGLECSTLAASVNGYSLTSKTARNNAELYRGNLNTLHTLSILCYDYANSIDTGETNQDKIKSVIADVKSTLNGLLRQNADNVFASELSYLIAECDDIAHGFVYSADLRRLQIAVTDCILNIRF